MFKSKSKVPIFVTSIYIAFSLMAFLVMFVYIDTDSFSGIFAILLTMPWSVTVIPFIVDAGIDSYTVKVLLMALGVVANAFTIYVICSFLTRKK